MSPNDTFAQCPSWRDVSLWSRSNGVYVAAPRTHYHILNQSVQPAMDPSLHPPRDTMSLWAGPGGEGHSLAPPMMLMICPSTACIRPILLAASLRSHPTIAHHPVWSGNPLGLRVPYWTQGSWAYFWAHVWLQPVGAGRN